MSGFPIQLAKVQPPPLRDDILSRPRLNTWLDDRVKRKVVLIIAEAGYGKTTLLADWSRSTSRRTIWYRLDTDDRDWLTFLTHLVAAGRQLDAAFGEESQELIGSLGPGGPTRDSIVSALVRELSELAGSAGLTLILDDFHAVDESDDIRTILKTLIDRSLGDLSFVIASRGRVSLALSRVRAHGGLAELSDEDLPFSRLELTSLAEAEWKRPVEDALITEIANRTEGWPASVRLILAALRKSSLDHGAFLHRLGRTPSEVHAFLAEEVVGRLSGELQSHLARCAILERIDSEILGVVIDLPSHEAAVALDQAERWGLLTRARHPETSFRIHPLLREFLGERLRAEVGGDAVARMHERVARYYDGRDWRVAASHFGAAGLPTEVERVVEQAIDDVLADGAYDFARGLLESSARESLAAVILQSRLHLQRGDTGNAIACAEKAVALARTKRHEKLAYAVLNNASIHLNALGSLAGILDELSDMDLDENEARLAAMMRLSSSSTERGSLQELVRELKAAPVMRSRSEGQHFAGISLLNIATAQSWLGQAAATLATCDMAEAALRASSSGFELGSVHLARIRALAMLGDVTTLQDVVAEALATSHSLVYAEVLVEASEAVAWFGSTPMAESLFEQLERLEPPARYVVSRHIALLHLGLRLNRRDVAARALDALMRSQESAYTEVAQRFREEFAIVRGAAALGRDAAGTAASLLETAGSQESEFQSAAAEVAVGLLRGPQDAANALRRLRAPQLHVCSMLAEELMEIADVLPPDVRVTVLDHAKTRPARWLQVARRAITGAKSGREAAIALLEEIGEREDAAALRGLSTARRRAQATTPPGTSLIRRLADRVFVEDLGRVRVNLGNQEVAGSSLRRKVAALLCFLISKPSGSATRDQVLEALWPDFDPATSNNSLNQTLYFLRRVFEPDYRELLSPGYVRFEGEVVWLDTTLIDSRSRRFMRLLTSAKGPSAPEVLAAIEEYESPFATDFIYEEWSQSYRDTVHAAYLASVEQLARHYEASSNLGAAITVLRRALAIDPEADQLESRLLALYSAAGSPAAAAEQYGHYATLIGETPPTPRRSGGRTARA